MRNKLLFIFFLGHIALFAQQTTDPQNDSIVQLQEVVLNGNAILGSKFAAKNRTGSAFFISSEDLQQFSYTDINRVLREVPGSIITRRTVLGCAPISVCGEPIPEEVPK